MLAEPTCTAGCRGALYVTVRCEGERVIWDAWENTSDATALPADMAFDAGQYEAELARAAADRDWEEPVDTLARLLGQTLAGSGWFERWGCVLTGVWPRREEPIEEQVQHSRSAPWATIHGRPPSHETAEGWVQERLS
ncbi:hypothetical protein ACPCDX_21060 [Streptomyces koyangensis]|uniref:hypothetical protein n=1 Tax=Streptomyces koyangensis TaxID=188770 RepID=UPI003C2E5066